MHTTTKDIGGELYSNEENVYTCVGCYWVLLTSARSLGQFYFVPDLLLIY